MLKIPASALVALVLVSCSEKKLPEASGEIAEVGTVAGSNEEVPSSGNRFFDSAVKKIHTLDPEVSPTQAAAIVTAMTADGSIGLGEINGMDLGDLSKNADGLQKAYTEAKAAALAK